MWREDCREISSRLPFLSGLDPLGIPEKNDLTMKTLHGDCFVWQYTSDDMIHLVTMVTRILCAEKSVFEYFGDHFNNNKLFEWNNVISQTLLRILGTGVA